MRSGRAPFVNRAHQLSSSFSSSPSPSPSPSTSPHLSAHLRFNTKKVNYKVKRGSVHGFKYGVKHTIARTTTPYTSMENKLLKDIDGLDVRLEEIKRVSLNSGYSQMSAFSEPPIPTYVSRARNRSRPIQQMSMPVPHIPAMGAAPGFYYIVPGIGQPQPGATVYPYQI